MIKKTFLSVATLLVVAGCANSTQDTTQTQNTGVTATQRTDANEYSVLFVDGKYVPSQIRGYTRALGTANNIKTFEEGLMDLSKNQFSPNNYYFMDGQNITTADVSVWLQKTSANAEGVNTDAENVVMFVEQNYLIKSGNDYALSGVSIGIAVNNEDEEGARAVGQQVASALLPKLRAKEGLANVRILFGIFQQNDNAGVSRGKYVSSAVSTSGDTIGNWTNNQFIKYVYPLDASPASDYETFETFRKNVERAFPNLNGVVGEATFENNVMTELKITITSQFYGQSEMIAFEQYLKEQSQVYLKDGLAVTIVVNTVRGSEIVLVKKATEVQFVSTVLN